MGTHEIPDDAIKDKKDLTFETENIKLDNMELGFSKIEGEHSIRDDVAAVNPNFAKSKDYQYNCGNCTAAYELRRRGFDVEAAPRMLMPVDEWKNLFEGFDARKVKTDDPLDLANTIEKDVLSWGIGARGMIYGKWAWEDIGHFFSFEVKGTSVLFIDSQDPGAIPSRYLSVMKPSSIVYGRTDNLKPSSGIKSAVIDKGKKQ